MSDSAKDYKDSVRIPRTSFSMKANLPSSEPKFLQGWIESNLYNRVMQNVSGGDKFILHDGPPYANGHLHVGHALNKILKDIILKGRRMMGFNAPFIPGWDCHGLPIEWKIEEEYRKKGINKDDIDVIEFRNKCREFAKKWISIQAEEFKRLGILADFDNYYNTMDHDVDATIMHELSKFVLNGSLYVGFKPVLWSVVEKTALAEAEVEYKEHTSDVIFVPFKIVEFANKDNWVGADVIIWTTTPWTIPANRAIAYSDDIEYALVEVVSSHEDSLIKGGRKFVVSKDLLLGLIKEFKVDEYKIVDTSFGLKDLVVEHPLNGKGYDFTVPALKADFVTSDAGTGIVHIAPSHGEDDFRLGKENNLEMPHLVEDNGVYGKDVPIFAGVHIYKANPAIIEELKLLDRLFAHDKLKHSYPHSWRSKAPLIYRLTRQIFIDIDKNSLRERVIDAIDNKIRFYPELGRKRIRSMVESRPDWCISRQRRWGVPIAIFINKNTFEPLADKEVLDGVIEEFKAHGSDAWYSGDVYRFLPSKYSKDDYFPLYDVVDVWFDSGSTHAFVLDKREELGFPADLYLEGSDQHRGWFQSSLMESMATKGVSPYKNIMTHGFLLDEKGYKMSKSLGNSISPEEIVKRYGADILRIWVANSNYYDDMKIGENILNQQADIYRKIRNTMRYLIANVDDYKKEEIAYQEIMEIDKLILHRLFILDKKVRETFIDGFNFHELFVEIYNFCSNDLSSFYFDIKKDLLYCGDVNSLEFRSTLFTFYQLFCSLSAYLAPFLSFTAEEIWQHIMGDESSIHEQSFPNLSKEYLNNELDEKWKRVEIVRDRVLIAIEEARAKKIIGSSLEASPIVQLATSFYSACEGLNMADICIVSAIDIIKDTQGVECYDKKEGEILGNDTLALKSSIAGIKVEFKKAQGVKCSRCWKIHNDSLELCNRCNEVVNG